MSKRYIQRVQSSVHGLMEFRGMEAAVIELLTTPEMQRLRRVRQLGLSDLVFPDAEHSRLAHSLGAAHLAVRFGRRLSEVASELVGPLLQPGPIEIRDFAIAALCHDLGHGPFSHAWEHECVGENFNRSAWRKSLKLDLNDQECSKLKWHEMVTLGLLTWPEGDLFNKLEQHERGTARRIQGFLRGNYHIPYLPRLISSDFDVDRGDFVVRDGEQAGVTYGRYDIDWMISTITLGYYKDRLVVGFDSRKARRALEQFIQDRRALYETVYYHHTVKAAEAMIGVIFKRLRHLLSIPSKNDWDGFLAYETIVNVARGQPLSLREIMHLDDALLWSFINTLANTSRSYDPIIHDLSNRLIHRRLYKEIYIKKKGGTIPIQTHYKVMSNVLKCVKNSIRYPKLSIEDISEYYYLNHVTEDELLSKRENEQSFFIDASQSSMPAFPIRDDREFLPIRLQAVSTNRLYVADEARDTVQAALKG